MITRIYLICIALLISSLSVGEGFATVTKTYIPASQISLTWTTSDVRFDVASPLFGSSFSGAYLDTGSRNMSGAFYIQDIGWALMSSGSYQVEIDCGAQSLSSLSTQCQFTGSGWAENIWELSFANVRYNPSTGKLSGSIGSFVGDISVDNISLPLRPVDLVESLVDLVADHETSLTVRSGSIYGDGIWEMQIIPLSSVLTKFFIGSSVGEFTSDLSFADTYTWEITDPQGSITRLSSVEVKPDTLSQTLDLTSPVFIEDICGIPSPKCPDGVVRSATKLDKNGTNKIADGSSYYDFTLKPRDRYGNRVDTGSVEISYTGTISNIQLPADVFSTIYIPGIWDPVLFQSSGFTFSDKKTTVILDGTDISYWIASRAPTDVANTLLLNDIKYTSPTGVASTFSDTDAVTFAKPYTVTLTPPATLLLGTENHFSGNMNTATAESLSPELITTLLIGDGLFANMSDIISDPAWVSKEDDTDWIMGVSNPSSITFPVLSATLGFTWTYSPYTAYPELEKLTYRSLIHYQAWGIDVIYPVDSGDQSSQYKASRIKILGQNNARAEYGTISTTSKSRADVFNQIRKMGALLSRGRTSYTDVAYTITTSNQNITNSYFNDKQTIIVVGKDITITENIDKDPDHPLAIIALAKDGVGGNIIIADDVTDIHASLFAEHAVLAASTPGATREHQLYIGGSLVSGNTLGETAAGICPYYVTGACDAKLYDLEELRIFDGTDPSKTASSPTAWQYGGTSLIIEYDMRLQTDPPPGLAQ